jgi:putative oxidoreductase
MRNAIDGAARRNEGLFLLVGRIAVAILFIWSSIGKFEDPGGFAGEVGAMGGPSSSILVIIAAIVELVGALGILLGFWTRLAALMLFVYTIIATLIGHHFWTFADAWVKLEGGGGPVNLHLDQEIHFLKNLVILGGLLFVFVHGAGSLSFDKR